MYIVCFGLERCRDFLPLFFFKLGDYEKYNSEYRDTRMLLGVPCKSVHRNASHEI